MCDNDLFFSSYVLHLIMMLIEMRMSFYINFIMNLKSNAHYRINYFDFTMLSDSITFSWGHTYRLPSISMLCILVVLPTIAHAINYKLGQ